MATQLFKLSVTASQPTTTTVPTDLRYFYTFTADFTGTTTTLNATDFVNDTGTAVTAFTTAAADNGYYQLYINGQLQQSGVYAVTSASIVLTFDAASTIYANTVLSLVVTNFDPNTTAPTINV